MFLLALLDSAGVPLPGGVDALLLVVAVIEPATAYMSAALAIVGSAIGSMILFYIARKGGQRYLERRTAAGLGRRMREWFQRYGLLTVFVPALIPIPMPMKVFVLSAGTLGVRPLAFLGVVLLARVPRYFALAYLGESLGRDAAGFLRDHAWHMIGIAVALFAFLYLLVKLKERWRPGLPAGRSI